MPISRLPLFSSKRRPRDLFDLFRRSAPNRIQSCNYTNSSNYSNGKPEPILPEETQSSRSWGTYVIPTALLGFAGLITFIHYNDERRAVPKGQGDRNSRSDVEGPIIGGPFTLVDKENRIVTERNIIGNWILLYFGYTSSPDLGPEQVQVMAKAIDVLESRDNVKVLPVFVTIDPQRDTPSQLHAYLKEFDSRIIGLTGPDSAVRQMAQEYRVYFKKIEEEGDDYLVESSHNMYLLNTSMEVVKCFGVEYNADELSEAILQQTKRTSNFNVLKI